MKNAYPSLYEAMRNHVVDEVASEADEGRVPSYERQAQLSMLTGIPLDATFRPDVIAFYQSVHGEMSAPQKAPERLPQPDRVSRIASRRGAFTDRETA